MNVMDRILHCSLQSAAKQERSLLIIFICISFTFIICHTPRMILNVYEFKMESDREACLKVAGTGKYIRPGWTIVLTCIEKILLILNSSANFVYYCFAGREFRRLFCHSIRDKGHISTRVSNLTKETKIEVIPMETQEDPVIKSIFLQ